MSEPKVYFWGGVGGHKINKGENTALIYMYLLELPFFC